MSIKSKISNVKKTAYTHDQAKEYDLKRFVSPSGKVIHSMELSLLKYFLNFASVRKNILEVGCGTGRLLTNLIKSGYIVDGADASPNMLKKLQEKIKSISIVPSLYESESANMPFDDNKYNFVYAIRLLNQTESKDYALRTIKEMVRITKPNGYVLVEFVNIKRPRIGRNSTKTTRLSHDIIKGVILSEDWNCTIVKNKGLFFFGMGAIEKTPSFLLGIFSGLDKMLSGLFPRYCSRGYILLKK